MGCRGGGERERESLLKTDAEAAAADKPPKYGTVEEIELYDERPLEENEKDIGDRRLQTPLPARQLAILLAMRAVEPLAYSQVFPVRVTDLCHHNAHRSYVLLSIRST